MDPIFDVPDDNSTHMDIVRLLSQATGKSADDDRCAKAQYLDDVKRHFQKLRRDHIQGRDLSSTIEHLMSLEMPGEYLFPPIAVYIESIQHRIDRQDMGFIKALLTHVDHSSYFMSGVLPHIKGFIEASIRHNNIPYFLFLTQDCQLQVESETGVSSCAFAPIQGNILCLAAEHGSLELLEYLVKEKGYDINARNFRGFTALTSALWAKETKVRDFVMTQDYDLTLHTDDNPFLIAIHQGDEHFLVSLSVKLAQKGFALADVHDSKGHIAIHWAIDFGATKLIPTLIKLLGQHIHVLTKTGLNAVLYALAQDKPDIASILVNQCPDIDLKLETTHGLNALHHCCRMGATKSVEWLLTKGFDLESRTELGDTVLLVAAQLKKYSFIEYLLWGLQKKRHKAVNVNALNAQGKHVGHYLADAPSQAVLLTKVLRDTSIDVFRQDIHGKTMLEIALEGGPSHYTLVRAILSKVQSVSKKKNHREKAIAILRKKEHLPQFLEFLVEEHANVTQNEFTASSQIGDWALDKQLPLHLLCAETAIDTISAYIERYNPDINARNKAGETALCYMVNQGKLKKAVLFIQKYQPQVTNLDSQESTLLHLAVEHQSVEFITWCLKTQALSVLAKRRGGSSALDIALSNRDLLVVQKLWSTLSPAECYACVHHLKQSGKNDEIKFLTENTLYTLPSDAALGDLSNDFLDEVLKHTIEDVATSALQHERSQYEKQREVTADKLALTAIEQAIIELRSEEHAEQLETITDELSTTAMMQAIVELKAEQRAAQLELKANALAEEAMAGAVSELEKEHQVMMVTKNAQALVSDAMQRAVEKSEEQRLAFIYQEMQPGLDECIDTARLLQAVEHYDLNFFYAFTHSTEHNEILKKSAVDVLLRSLEYVDPYLTKLLLSIPSIKEGAHLENNAVLKRAKQFYRKDIVRHLLTIPQVYQAEASRPVIFQSTPGAPRCYENPNYAYILTRLCNILCSYPELQRLFACIYGSGIYNPLANDVDILLPLIRTAHDKDAVMFLVKILTSSGAKVTSFDETGMPGYHSPKENPTRHVIPMEWMGCRIELVSTHRTLHQHAENLDFTISAMYYDIRHSTFYTITNSSSWHDLKNSIIDTIVEPGACFQNDLFRIFRAIRMLAANKHLKLAQRCVDVVHEIFSMEQNPDVENPFFHESIVPVKIVQHLVSLFSAAPAPTVMQILHDFNVLPFLIPYLKCIQDPACQFYADYLCAERSKIEQFMLAQRSPQPSSTNGMVLQSLFPPQEAGIPTHLSLDSMNTYNLA